MNSIERVFSYLDRKFEGAYGWFKGYLKRFFPILSTLVLVLFVSVFVLRVFLTRPYVVASIIEDDVKIITLALEKIDADCNILGIKGEVNEIDFLNVKSFSGSTVGSLSLAYPDKWEGPYLSVNPTIQDKFYEIVRVSDGFIVMPGRGVTIPGDKVVGEDFAVRPSTIFDDLVKEGAPLNYEGRIFAAKLTFKIGDWDPWILKKSAVKDLNKALENFSHRMSLSKK